jgi:hypothetical protein
MLFFGPGPLACLQQQVHRRFQTHTKEVHEFLAGRESTGGKAVLIMDADASQVISMRCAIHGTEVNHQQGNTYLCAVCFELSGKKHSG